MLASRPSGRTHRGRTAVVLAVLGLLVVTSFGVNGSSVTPATSSQLKAFDTHVQHVVYVMLENHAYDSYFGTYCQSASKYCRSLADGIPAGTCVPTFAGSSACVRPFNFTVAQLAPPTMAHTWASTHQAVDNGAMDGFYLAEGSTPETFGHYNGSTVPVYWDLAEEYGLADDFFSSAASHSLPNHWYAVAGAA